MICTFLRPLINFFFCKLCVSSFRNLDFKCCSGLLADEPGCLLTVPVIPVPDTKSKDILVFQESKAVLSVPIVRLVPHPVEPFDFNAIVIPGPVAKVVIAMRSVHCGSDPPLVAVLVSRESR